MNKEVTPQIVKKIELVKALLESNELTAEWDIQRKLQDTFYDLTKDSFGVSNASQYSDKDIDTWKATQDIVCPPKLRNLCKELTEVLPESYHFNEGDPNYDVVMDILGANRRYDHEGFNLSYYSFCSLIQKVAEARGGWHFSLDNHNDDARKKFKRSKYVKRQPDGTYNINPNAYTDHPEVLEGVVIQDLTKLRFVKDDDNCYDTQRLHENGAWECISYDGTLREAIMKLGNTLRYIENRAVTDAKYNSVRGQKFIDRVFSDEEVRTILCAKGETLEAEKSFAVISTGDLGGVYVCEEEELDSTLDSFTKRHGEDVRLEFTGSYKQASNIKFRLTQAVEKRIEVNRQAKKLEDLLAQVAELTTKQSNSKTTLNKLEERLVVLLGAAQ